MISDAVVIEHSLPNRIGTKPLLPHQALMRAIIERDRQGASVAIAAGANPMGLVRRAIEWRQGHVDFLLLFIEGDCKEHIEPMAVHLEAWGRYPKELESIEKWLAAH